MHRLFHPPVALAALHDRLESARRHQRDEIHAAHDLRRESGTLVGQPPAAPSAPCPARCRP
jgi:hypothetical protein